MGQINIQSWGSFPKRSEMFSALEHGHAHAVAEAIRYLADEVLPEAIERDHRLQAGGETPHAGFDRPERKA
jgi:hypothetical protein